MKQIAWYPNLSAPPELTAVLLPQGQVSHKEWVQALSDRVSDLVLKEKDPQKAANEACLLLNLPSVDEPNQLGESLVQGNLDLLTYLNVAELEENPYQKAEEKPEARKALEEVNLAQWVELAAAQVSESNLV